MWYRWRTWSSVYKGFLHCCFSPQQCKLSWWLLHFDLFLKVMPLPCSWKFLCVQVVLASLLYVIVCSSVAYLALVCSCLLRLCSTCFCLGLGSSCLVDVPQPISVVSLLPWVVYKTVSQAMNCRTASGLCSLLGELPACSTLELLSLSCQVRCYWPSSSGLIPTPWPGCLACPDLPSIPWSWQATLLMSLCLSAIFPASNKWNSRIDCSLYA